MYLHKLSARSNGQDVHNNKGLYRGSLETIKDEMESHRSPVADDKSGDLMAKVHQIHKQRPFSSNNYAPILSQQPAVKFPTSPSNENSSQMLNSGSKAYASLAQLSDLSKDVKGKLKM